MKNVLLTVLIIFTSLLGYGQSTAAYKLWKFEAQNDVRLMPKYGGVEKVNNWEDDDATFIRTILKVDKTNEKASARLVQLGFSYLGKGDFNTAMHRFNQAWVLNPKNEDIFWGFGVLYYCFNDFDNALKQYDEGLLLNPNNSGIITDKATVFMTRFNQTKQAGNLTTAIQLLLTSFEIDPNNEKTAYKLSVCYYLKSDCDYANRYYQLCKSLGGRSITKEYAAAIKKLCKI